MSINDQQIIRSHSDEAKKKTKNKMFFKKKKHFFSVRPLLASTRRVLAERCSMKRQYTRPAQSFKQQTDFAG